MINFSIPPKPGEVFFDAEQLRGLTYQARHSVEREGLIKGAGFAIGSILANECETPDDVTVIIGELVNQSLGIFDERKAFGRAAPNTISAEQLASLLEYGMERGRIIALDLPPLLPKTNEQEPAEVGGELGYLGSGLSPMQAEVYAEEQL